VNIVREVGKEGRGGEGGKRERHKVVVQDKDRTMTHMLDLGTECISDYSYIQADGAGYSKTLMRGCQYKKVEWECAPDSRLGLLTLVGPDILLLILLSVGLHLDLDQSYLVGVDWRFIMIANRIREMCF
jgi:hypothetical protein